MQLSYVLLLVSMALVSYNYPDTQVITLEKAIAGKLVSAEVYASKHLENDNMGIHLKNLKNTPLTVVVEAGTLFTAVDSALQNMLLVEPREIKLAPLATRVVNLTAFCTEMDDYCPQEDEVYTIARVQDDALQQLV